MKRSMFCAVALLAIACSDDNESPLPEPTTDASVAPDAAPPTTTPAPDASTPAVSKAIPLIDWVDDLLDHHTDDVSPPDTVDDKNIIDDENSAVFDSRFK